MDLEAFIRQQARSNYWQQIYSSSKELGGINLFENTNNFSAIQYAFLYWLKVYHMLYDELAQKEWINLTENCIEDDIRCDAFLTWRRKEQEKKLEEYKREQRKAESKSKKNKFPIYKGPRNKLEGE